MENQDSFFINELWVNWKLDCAVIVYCSFLTKCMTTNQGDLDYGDILGLSYYLCEEEVLLKEMLHAFEVAESMEDGDRKVQIMSLKEGFQSLQSQFLDQVTNCLGDSYSLLHEFDTINLGKDIERYKNVIRNNDNPYPSAACALSAPLLHLRLHCYLAEYISDRFFHHNSLLDTYSSEAAKSLLLRGEAFLLCSDQGIDKAKEMYVEAMKSEMEVFFSRGGIGMAEVGIPLSRLKCYADLQTMRESFVIEQPLGIFFSATSSLSPSTQMVLARSLANSEYEEFVNKSLINATSMSFEYSTLSQVVNQMVLIRESVAHSDVGDFEPTFEYGFEKFLHNCLKVGLPLYSKVHENWLLHQIRPSILASGLNLVSDLEDFRTIKSALNPGTKIVYIGDSITDFSYLLEADIGIIIREESRLKEFGNHFGLKFVPLLKWLTGECIEHFDRWGPKTGRLFSVESWVEVHAFLIGHYGIRKLHFFHGYTD